MYEDGDGGDGDADYDSFKTDHHFTRENMLGDIMDQRAGIQNEVNYGNKRFKLYEKKALDHKKATLFCKKREGKLAQGKSY